MYHLSGVLDRMAGARGIRRDELQVVTDRGHGQAAMGRVAAGGLIPSLGCGIV